MKILVRATNWVGDAVMCIPALRAVRDRWPQAEIVILARPWVADLYRGQGYADRILIYDNKIAHRGFWGREKLAATLRREKFDVALLFQNAFDAAWIAWRARIPQRIGYARYGRSWFLTQAIPVPAKGEAPDHEVYDYLELLRRAEWINRLPLIDEISITVGQQDREKALQRLLASGVRKNSLRIAFAAGAAYGSAKCWDPRTLRSACGSSDCLLRCRRDTFRRGSREWHGGSHPRRHAAARLQSGRCDPNRRTSGLALLLRTFYRQRFRSHARRRRRGSSHQSRSSAPPIPKALGP